MSEWINQATLDSRFEIEYDPNSKRYRHRPRALPIPRAGPFFTWSTFPQTSGWIDGRPNEI